MTIARVREIVAEYRALLGLSEWDIRARWSKPGELPHDDGQVRWQPEYCLAEIILSRKQADAEIPKTVVHELCHLALQGHAVYSGKYDPGFERGINRITDAILQR